jgi:hypothetical protein
MSRIRAIFVQFRLENTLFFDEIPETTQEPFFYRLSPFSGMIWIFGFRQAQQLGRTLTHSTGRENFGRRKCLNGDEFPPTPTRCGIFLIKHDSIGY